MAEGRRQEIEVGGAGVRADRDVVEAVYRAAGACVGGFDETVLGAVHDVLRDRFPLDAVVLSVEAEDRQSVCLLARASVGAPLGIALATGAHLERCLEGLPFHANVSAPPVIVEDIEGRDGPLDRVLRDAGARSYVSVPVAGDSGVRLSILHVLPGAPSQQHLALLLRVARALGPAITRARTMTRAGTLDALVDASPDGMLALDGAFVVREANRAAVKLLGRPRTEIIGRPLADSIGRAPAEAVAAVLARKGDPVRLALVVRVGEIDLPVDALVGMLFRTSTEARYHVHLRDARDRRVAEEAMARRLEHLSFLRALGESLGSDLRVQTAVERALDVCIARRPISAIAALRGEDSGTLRLVASRGASEALTSALARIRRDELEALRPEGRWSLVLPLSHARRTWGALFVVGRDSTQRVDAERELWDSVGSTVSAALHAAQDFEHVVELEAEKRLLVDSLPVLVARIEPGLGWSTSFVNGAAEQILGIPPADLQGLPGLDAMLDPVDLDAARAARRRASLGEKVGWEDRRYRQKDGRLLTLRENVYPVHDVDGTVRSVQLIAYDITTEIESRRRLVHADRLASLGSLAAGIAHEINNPVAFIGLAAGQIPRQKDPERVKELTHEIGEAANRIAHIVGELKLFTRIPDGASATPVDVNRMLEMAVTLTSAEIRRRARLDVSLGDVPLAPGRYSGLGQAFVNLMLNGAHAVEQAPSGKARVVTVTSAHKNDAIVVEFTDSGPGVAPEHLPRIFDPFFTPDTSTPSSGAGLGLSIAYDVVRRAGGDIRVTSAVGEGTKFEVVLELDAPGERAEEDRPSAHRLMTFERPAGSAAPTEEGRRRVLIIDDEHALAKALARQLAARYDVDTASTAADALAQLSIHAYDAVVCDLRMPDQSGPSIYEAVAARSAQQAARFIFTTGGSYGMSDDEIHERARTTGRPILEKPFDGASFEAAVAEIATPRG